MADSLLATLYLAAAALRAAESVRPPVPTGDTLPGRVFHAGTVGALEAAAALVEGVIITESVTLYRAYRPRRLE
jgi:hypothetical protein